MTEPITIFGNKTMKDTLKKEPLNDGCQKALITGIYKVGKKYAKEKFPSKEIKKYNDGTKITNPIIYFEFAPDGNTSNTMIESFIYSSYLDKDGNKSKLMEFADKVFNKNNTLASMEVLKLDDFFGKTIEIDIEKDGKNASGYDKLKLKEIKKSEEQLNIPDVNFTGFDIYKHKDNFDGIDLDNLPPLVKWFLENESIEYKQYKEDFQKASDDYKNKTATNDSSAIDDSVPYCG